MRFGVSEYYAGNPYPTPVDLAPKPYSNCLVGSIQVAKAMNEKDPMSLFMALKQARISYEMPYISAGPQTVSTVSSPLPTKSRWGSKADLNVLQAPNAEIMGQVFARLARIKT